MAARSNVRVFAAKVPPKVDVAMPAVGLKVESDCYESYPCKHFVTLPGNGYTMREMWSGDAIAAWFVDHGQPVPAHFKEYLTPEYKQYVAGLQTEFAHWEQ